MPADSAHLPREGAALFARPPCAFAVTVPDARHGGAGGGARGAARSRLQEVASGLCLCLFHTAAAQPERHTENAHAGVHARGLALDHPHAHHPAMPRAAVRLLIDGIHLLIAFSSFSMNCSSCISPSSSR